MLHRITNEERLNFILEYIIPMVRRVFALIIIFALIVDTGYIKYPPFPENSEKENKQPGEEEYENRLPEKVNHFPPNEITVEFINSTYAIASDERSGTFHTGQEVDIMLSGIDFNRRGDPLMFNHSSGIATDGKHLLLADTFNHRVLTCDTPPDGDGLPDVVL